MDKFNEEMKKAEPNIANAGASAHVSTASTSASTSNASNQAAPVKPIEFNEAQYKAAMNEYSAGHKAAIQFFEKQNDHMKRIFELVRESSQFKDAFKKT